MMKLFTDIDLDGLGCGVLAKIAFGNKADVSYCSYRNLNQRVESFLEKNEKNKQAEVFITDLAVNKEVEEKLNKRFKKGKNVRMIDHHVTALHFNEYEWGMVKTEYESGKKTSATSLFYDYLVKNKKIKETSALEEFIDLIRQYDTWEWEENQNHQAKRLNDLFYIVGRDNFEEEMIKRLLSSTDSFWLTDTENKLLDIEESKIERYIQSKSRQLVQTSIDEFCVGIVHAENYLSELGNALSKQNPHFDMIAMINVGGKKVGFRTFHDDVNVAEFAKKFGGGGHPKASGCELTTEAFEKFVINVFPHEPVKVDPEQNELNVKGASYGTVYQNRMKEISNIIPHNDGTFMVIHMEKKVKEIFNNFMDAERFVKRNYGSWLCHDEDCLEKLSTDHSLSKEQALANYAMMMHQISGTKKEPDLKA